MATQELLLSFLLFCLLAGHEAVHGSPHHPRHHHQHDPHSSDCVKLPFRATKLFVFGDSYADTGNNKKSEARSWKVPYGMTFPGIPSGRFSDGLVLTDYLVKFFRVMSPLPIEWWPKANAPHFRLGTNFAYGGTGVFNTLSSEPNMTVQIDHFESLIGDAFFKAAVTQSSVAIFTNSGQRLRYLLGQEWRPLGCVEGLLDFIDKVVAQLAANMKRVYSLGVRKIAVAALQPLGCLPQFTAPSFKKCNDTVGLLVDYHNEQLKGAVEKLNNETSPSTFIIVDLDSAFKWVIQNTTIFKNPMKPCCMGVSSEYNCWNVDANGKKMYTLCEDPGAYFFWGHGPSYAGWLGRCVFDSSTESLSQFHIPSIDRFY
ncbi:hypothetical protein NL676_002029 [Syzygium grande]|nr:hypothetical protein NL676_002029 [Syzygium grande]